MCAKVTINFVPCALSNLSVTFNKRNIDQLFLENSETCWKSVLQILGKHNRKAHMYQ